MKRPNEFKLRYRRQLHDRLKKAASDNGVSLNAEITKRLQQLLDQDDLFEEAMVEFIKLKSRDEPKTGV